MAEHKFVDDLVGETAIEEALAIGQAVRIGEHGIVWLQRVYGNEKDIVAAARVSYQKGTTRVQTDEGLVDYLLRHLHTSPSEMAEVRLMLRMPQSIAVHLLRHRTACLSGDTKLWFDEPFGLGRGGRKRRAMSIAEFYKKWHFGAPHVAKTREIHLSTQGVDPDRLYTVPELAKASGLKLGNVYVAVKKAKLAKATLFSKMAQREVPAVLGSDWVSHRERPTEEIPVDLRPRLEKMSLRSCNEETGEIYATHVTDIWETGVKPVFRVTLEGGNTVKMTEDHRCLTDAGWMTLAEAVSPKLNPETGVTSWRPGPLFAANGQPVHRSAEWLKTKRAQGLSVSQIADEAGMSYHTIRKELKAKGLQFTPKERAALSSATQRGTKRQGLRWNSNSGKNAKRGPENHFWRGGVSTDRESVGAWTTSNAKKVHEANNFQCVNCGSGGKLHAHHVVPVFKSRELAQELSNLTTMCVGCHTRLHALGLEQELETRLKSNTPKPFNLFDLGLVSERQLPKSQRSQKLARTFKKVVAVEYAGEEMTYDLSVRGPFHNFVADGFVVHNSVNAESARYSILSEDYWLPELSGKGSLRAPSGTNKQAGEVPLEAELNDELRAKMDEANKAAFKTYNELLAANVCREQARMVLPNATFTRLIFKQDLNNLIKMLKLRDDDHAQYETQAYAKAIKDLVRPHFPNLFASAEEHVWGAVNVPKSGFRALTHIVNREALEEALVATDSTLTTGAKRELLARFKPEDQILVA